MSLPQDAEQFLKSVRQGLSRVDEKEREEIVNELRTHLLDRQAQGKADLLEGFDAPEVLASAFVSELALRGALARGTSWAMGRALLFAARDSALVLLIVFPLILLQLCGAGFIALGVLKPVIPQRIGLWVGAGNLTLGFTDPSPGVHEVLGWWAIPVLLVVGLIVLWSSNRAMRAVIRWRLGPSKLKGWKKAPDFGGKATSNV